MYWIQTLSAATESLLFIIVQQPALCRPQIRLHHARLSTNIWPPRDGLQPPAAAILMLAGNCTHGCHRQQRLMLQVPLHCTGLQLAGSHHTAVLYRRTPADWSTRSAPGWRRHPSAWRPPAAGSPCLGSTRPPCLQGCKEHIASLCSAQ